MKKCVSTNLSGNRCYNHITKWVRTMPFFSAKCTLHWNLYWLAVTRLVSGRAVVEQSVWCKSSSCGENSHPGRQGCRLWPTGPLGASDSPSLSTLSWRGGQCWLLELLQRVVWAGGNRALWREARHRLMQKSPALQDALLITGQCINTC